MKAEICEGEYFFPRDYIASHFVDALIPHARSTSEELHALSVFVELWDDSPFNPTLYLVKNTVENIQRNVARSGFFQLNG